MAEDIQADLDFYKNFRSSKNDISEKKLRERQRLTPDSAEFRAVMMRLEWERKRQARREEVRQQVFDANVTPSKKSEVGLSARERLTQWYKKLEVRAIPRFDRFADKVSEAVKEGRLAKVDNSKDLTNKADLQKLQTSFPERYFGKTIDQDNKLWEVNLQSAFGVEKENRNSLKVGEEELTELQVVWFTNKDSEPPRAFRYVLADNGDWYRSVAESFVNDSEQQVDKWKLGEYKKLDEEFVNTIQNEVDNILTSSELNLLRKTA